MARKKTPKSAPEKVAKYVPVTHINGVSVFDQWGNKRTIRPNAQAPANDTKADKRKGRKAA